MDTLAVGDAIEMYWPTDKKYYAGHVAECSAHTGTHRVLYDDGEVEDLDLTKEQWRVVRKVSTRNPKQIPLKPYASIYGQPRLRSPVTVTAIPNSITLPPSRSWIHSGFKRKQVSQPTPTMKRRRRKQAHPRRRQQTTQCTEWCQEGKSPFLSRAQQPNVPALLLIENCVDSWLRNEIRRQFDMFSAYQCLSHTFNMLTYAALDPTYQSKLLCYKSTIPKCISMVPLTDVSRKIYDGWRQPHSDDEWQTEKQMLVNISALVLEGVEKSDRPEKPINEEESDIVEAMRYVLYARKLCTLRK